MINDASWQARRLAGSRAADKHALMHKQPSRVSRLGSLARHSRRISSSVILVSNQFQHPALQSRNAPNLRISQSSDPLSSRYSASAAVALRSPLRSLEHSHIGAVIMSPRKETNFDRFDPSNTSTICHTPLFYNHWKIPEEPIQPFSTRSTSPIEQRPEYSSICIIPNKRQWPPDLWTLLSQNQPPSPLQKSWFRLGPKRLL